MFNYKLGFGPMSKEITKSLKKYTKELNYPLMIIASRNQVDAIDGYVMTTKELTTITAKTDNLLICRDHCGPYFLDSERSLSERLAIEATKRTIAADIDLGFDLIHIDTSRVENNYKVAEELIKFCLDLNPNIMFEFGTEENVGVAAGMKKYKDDVDFAKQFPNMIFVVAQTGSLVMEDRQVGDFALEEVTELVNYANQAGIRLKEHNADYLTTDQIRLRKNAGVHALNIAPQLGVIQTQIVENLCKEHGLESEFELFGKKVLESTKWKKWHIDGDNHKKITMAGHYLFRSNEYKIIEHKLGSTLSTAIEHGIFQIVDLYRNNLQEQ